MPTRSVPCACFSNGTTRPRQSLGRHNVDGPEHSRLPSSRGGLRAVSDRARAESSAAQASKTAGTPEGAGLAAAGREGHTLVMRKPSTSSTLFMRSCVSGRDCGTWEGHSCMTSRAGRGFARGALVVMGFGRCAWLLAPRQVGLATA